MDWTRRPIFWLIVVGSSFFLAQLVFFDLGRGLEWDEAVYLSRTGRFDAVIDWSAHRAPGVVFLVWPVASPGVPIEVMRLFLAGVSAVAVTVAFGRWLTLLGWIAPLAAAVFAVGWLPLVYGSELSPNLLVACVVVAAAGSLVRYVDDGRRSDLVWLGVASGVAVLLRPSDAAVLAVFIAGTALVLTGLRTTLRVVSAVVVGGAVGALPWLIQSFSAFGGPLDRLSTASDIVGGGFAWNGLELLLLADGPLIGPDTLRTVGLAAAVVAVVRVGLAAVGVGTPRKRRIASIAAAGAAVMALPYVFYVDALAPRFLLPSLALLSIATGIGLAELWTSARALKVLAAIAFVGLATFGATVAVSVEQAQADQRAGSDAVGAAIAADAEGNSCLVLAQYGYPQIALSSGCVGARGDVSTLVCVAEEATSNGAVVYIASVSVWAESLPPNAIEIPSDASNWTIWRVDSFEQSLCDA